MKTFREWIAERELQETIRPVKYKPGAVVPPLFRNSGPEKMSAIQSIAPSKPYMPIFRAGKGQAKTQIINRKH